VTIKILPYLKRIATLPPCQFYY